MKFNILEISDNHIPEIIRWFDDRKWPLPGVPAIGPKIGAVAENNGVIYACVYSYITGTSVAFLEWTATNPDVPQDDAMKAFDDLLFHFKKMCELSNPKVRVLCLVTQSAAFASRLKKHGFKIQEECYKAVWTLKE